jgi:hypothetical protein
MAIVVFETGLFVSVDYTEREVIVDNRELEYWLSSDGAKMMELEKNPCRCCSDTYDQTKESYDGKLKRYFIGYLSRGQINEWMKRDGYELLA